MKTQRAFTLIELLVAMSLVAILATMSFPSLKNMGQMLRQLRTRQEATITVDSAHRELALALHNSHAISFIKGYAVFREDSFGNASAVSYYLRNHPQKAGSSALSVIHPLPEFGGRIINREGEDFTFCVSSSVKNSSFTPDEYSWLLIGYTGYVHRAGAAHFVTTPECLSHKALTVKTSKLALDLLSSSPYDFSASTFLAVIPVRECFSIYLDRENILRKIYAVSGQNQPLLNEVESFSIDEEAFNSNISKLTIDILPENNAQLARCVSSRSYLHVVNHRQLLDFL